MDGLVLRVMSRDDSCKVYCVLPRIDVSSQASALSLNNCQSQLPRILLGKKGSKLPDRLLRGGVKAKMAVWLRETRDGASGCAAMSLMNDTMKDRRLWG